MAQLLAVCDINAQRLNDEQDKELLLTTQFSELLAMPNVEVINVCTPNHLHAPMTVAALQAGKHVVCEKPMALSSVQCTAMMDAAKKSGKKLFVVKQNRYNPPVQAVKQIA